MSGESDMTSVESNLAIMFADIEGSTKLYKKYGDAEAKAVIFSSLNMMGKFVDNRGGLVVKTIGDEVMCKFDDATSAVQAAQDIQRHFEHFDDDAHGKISVRIGVHYGHAIVEHGDVFGDVVNDAAYIVRTAKGKQVVYSTAVLGQLSSELKHQSMYFDSIQMKSGSSTETLYLLSWQDNEDDGSVTMMSSGINSGQSAIEDSMFLKYAGQTLQLKSNMSLYRIGRDQSQCDLVVNSRYASRKHIWIVFRRGKFVLVDHSTNGTWIKTQAGNEVYLRREELPLRGEGLISLGESFEDSTEQKIEFFC